MTILYYISFLISTNPRVPIFLGIGKPLPLYPHLGIVGSHEASIVNGNGTHLQGVWRKEQRNSITSSNNNKKKYQQTTNNGTSMFNLLPHPGKLVRKTNHRPICFFPKSGLRFYVKLHGHVWYIMVIMVLISVTVPLSSHRLFQWLASFFRNAFPFQVSWGSIAAD